MMKKFLLLFVLMFIPMLISAEEVEIGDIRYNLIEKGEIAEVIGGKYYTGSIVIPEHVTYNGTNYTVTSIGENAFNYQPITSITIPPTVTSIGSYAFHDTNLSEVHISDLEAWCKIVFPTYTRNPLQEAGHLFLNGEEIKDLVIPDGITSLEGSFTGCSSLTSVTIPNSVTYIGFGTFYDCRGLTSVVIPNSVKTLGSQAFRNCSGLTFVSIPNSVTSIGEYVFEACSKLSSVTIGNEVQAIKYGAFQDCISLETVIIGKKVSSISSLAFHGCKKLTDVYCYAEKVPSAGSEAFEGSFIEYATLHVPRRSLTLYQTTSPWSRFKEILPIDKTYTLTYIVDGEVYKSYEIEYNASITPEPAPTKEGYTFDGWSEIPYTMPAEDVVITGSFSINSYIILYLVDGEEYKTSTIVYGTKIVPEEEPTKEGYTFSGWSNIPAIMPAHDVVVTGNFIISYYALTYMVDDEIYKSYEVEYGTAITPEPAPTKEGYTFSGWSNIPETMPAHDVTVTGSFTENTYYTLIYIVDGQIYKTYTVAYGDAITPEPAPTKEGYTFSGWSYIPPTMPATDVVVMGTFSINSYTLTYEVDGQIYKTYTVVYGTTITPEAEPTKEGYTFSGWSEIPKTMPAYDVTVTGSFTKDILGTCAKPTISYANGELTFNSETGGVTFHYDIDIEDNEIRNGNSDKVQLSVTYHISVYATKEDYYDSEVATGTLCWIDVKPATEGIIIKDDATEVNEVKALPVLIQSNGGTITIQGVAEGTPIAIYDIDGKQYGSAISEKDCTTIATSLRPGTIAIVKIGKKSIKVLVK